MISLDAQISIGCFRFKKGGKNRLAFLTSVSEFELITKPFSFKVPPKEEVPSDAVTSAVSQTDSLFGSLKEIPFPGRPTPLFNELLFAARLWVLKEHRGFYDPADRATRPDVQQILQRRGVPPHLAKSISTIVRPKGLPRGRLPKDAPMRLDYPCAFDDEYPLREFPQHVTGQLVECYWAAEWLAKANKWRIASKNPMPINSEVVGALLERGKVTKSLAQAIAQILRDPNQPRGRQPSTFQTKRKNS